MMSLGHKLQLIFLLTMAVRENEKEKFPTAKVVKIAITACSQVIVDG
jgi:hypothetical protein